MKTTFVYLFLCLSIAFCGKQGTTSDVPPTSPNVVVVNETPTPTPTEMETPTETPTPTPTIVTAFTCEIVNGAPFCGGAQVNVASTCITGQCYIGGFHHGQRSACGIDVINGVLQ